MYSVHQHWDPLKVCLVGQSYSPEFYSFIKNSKVRSVMEQIAQETEEDYQKLIALLESFDVKVLRPTVSDDYQMYIDSRGKIRKPPMTPRDYSAMIGDTLYFTKTGNATPAKIKWDELRGADWPENPPKTYAEYQQLPDFIMQELGNLEIIDNTDCWDSILENIENPIVYGTGINSAMVTRVGKDLYFGTEYYNMDQEALYKKYSLMFPDYRCHIIDTGGHADSVFCPVVPGLIISQTDIPTYQDTFPGWEVVYLPKENWPELAPLLRLKQKNKGKWWVPGQEDNSTFTDFVESTLDHWIGYSEETVFDINILAINEKNVVCNNYNKAVFDALERHGVTPHILNIRHRYFWDGGLHCNTSDIDRQGSLKDYFPGRN